MVRKGVVILAFAFCAMIIGCESHDIPSGAACVGPYAPKTGHTCASGLQCVLVGMDAGADYLCAVACRTSTDCATLGAGYSCSPPMVHEGIGACVR